MRTQEPRHLEAYYGPLRGWFNVRATPYPTGLTLTLRNVDDAAPLSPTRRRSSVGSKRRCLARTRHSPWSWPWPTRSASRTSPRRCSSAPTGRWGRRGGCGAGLRRRRVAAVRDLGFAAVGDRGRVRDPRHGRVERADGLRTRRQPMYHSSRGELGATYPNLAATVEEPGTHAFASVPQPPRRSRHHQSWRVGRRGCAGRVIEIAIAAVSFVDSVGVGVLVDAVPVLRQQFRAALGVGRTRVARTPCRDR
jgi:hypothetical protein